MIFSITGGLPHSDYGTWENFLATCELREVVHGVKCYQQVNCFYVVFPCGMLISNYGYRGPALMRDIETLGVEAVKAELIEARRTIDLILGREPKIS